MPSKRKLTMRQLRHLLELCGKVGDDGMRKAAYRGGNQPSRTSRKESDTPWMRIAPSSAFASPMMWMIP
jgi:hypothetical protein